MLKALSNFSQKPKNIEMIQRLLSAGVSPGADAPTPAGTTLLTGKTVVFTGSISISRSEAKNWLKPQVDQLDLQLLRKQISW